jgi:hypothetical protein
MPVASRIPLLFPWTTLPPGLVHPADFVGGAGSFGIDDDDDLAYALELSRQVGLSNTPAAGAPGSGVSGAMEPTDGDDNDDDEGADATAASGEPLTPAGGAVTKGESLVEILDRLASLTSSVGAAAASVARAGGASVGATAGGLAAAAATDSTLVPGWRVPPPPGPPPPEAFCALTRLPPPAAAMAATPPPSSPSASPLSSLGTSRATFAML